MSRRSPSPVNRVLEDLVEAECDFAKDIAEEAYHLQKSRMFGCRKPKYFDVPVLPLKTTTTLLITTQTRKNIAKKQLRVARKHQREQELQKFLQAEGPFEISKILQTLKDKSEEIQDLVAAKFRYEGYMTRVNSGMSLPDDLTGHTVHQDYLAIMRQFKDLSTSLKWEWCYLELAEARLEKTIKNKKLCWH